jgi:hypothetical protein
MASHGDKPRLDLTVGQVYDRRYIWNRRTSTESLLCQNCAEIPVQVASEVLGDLFPKEAKIPNVTSKSSDSLLQPRIEKLQELQNSIPNRRLNLIALLELQKAKHIVT